MKKKVSAILCAVCLAAVCVLMTACGGGGKYADSKYLGKWKATKAEYMGLELSVEEILGGEFSFTLDADGKVTLKVVDEEEKGSWEEVDGGIQLEGDEEMTFKDEEGVLKLDYQGVALTFEKE